MDNAIFSANNNHKLYYSYFLSKLYLMKKINLLFLFITIVLVSISHVAANNVIDNDATSAEILETEIKGSVVSREVTRRPLFEMFTSSTCPPCAPFNINFFNNFAASNAEDLTVIKYQMNWPGAGDPYYTPEGGTRRLYYGITGVPSVVLDGSQIAANSSVVNNAFQNALQVPAFVDISGNYEVEGNNIIIEGSVMPYIDFSNVRLHVVVVESVTYGNVGGNGETEFHYVMHKMLPNAQGTTVSLTADEAYEFSHNYNMSNTNVEEMDDLMVVVFLQNHATKEVYQSNHMEYGIVETFSVSFDVVDASGEPITDAVITLGFDENEPGDYTFHDLLPRNYNYTVQRDCSPTVSGQVSVIDEDVFVEVELQPIFGDANGDGQVDVADIILMANYFATIGDINGFCFENADINQDGDINALDIILLIHIFSGD